MRPVTGRRWEKGKCKKCEVVVLDHLEALTPPSRSVPDVALSQRPRSRDADTTPSVRGVPLGF
jgi:hypothetical protein